MAEEPLPTDLARLDGELRCRAVANVSNECSPCNPGMNRCVAQGGRPCQNGQGTCNGSGTCVSNQRPNGQSCNGPGDCISGFCVNSGSGSRVCCNSACPGQSADSCGFDGTCGGGNCRRHRGNPCGTARCSGGNLTERGTCDGNGRCNQRSTPCRPFLCELGGTRCQQPCDQARPGEACAPGFFCFRGANDEGECFEQFKQGDGCDFPEQCERPLTCDFNALGGPLCCDRCAAGQQCQTDGSCF